MSNGTNLKVKDISKFKKSSSQFEVGDIVMYEDNIGIVTGLTPDGSVIVDGNKIVSDAEPANIYNVEAYRSDLIPHVEGISYVEVINTARRTTKYVVADEMAPYNFFKNICKFHNVPIDPDDITSAGGIGYDYSIRLIKN
jgi:hypothetical protein